MKGKKGGESATSGVAFPNSAIPCTSKGNIMAAAKKRKRGGAVANGPMKIGGDAPKMRMDKPKRARKEGGAVDSEFKKTNASRNMMFKLGPLLHDVEHKDDPPLKHYKEAGFRPGDSTGRNYKNDSSTGRNNYRANGGFVKQAEKTAGKMLSAAEKPKRARGGKIGADTKPMTHAAHKRPMRGHATEPNIT